MGKIKGLFILGESVYSTIYPPAVRSEIERLVEIVAPLQTAASIREQLPLLRDVEVIFSGWGAPRLDQRFLDAAPNLKVFFYGAGSIKYIVTDEFWDRDIIITSAYAANAVPVAEYALSQIIMAAKKVHYFMRAAHCEGKFPPRIDAELPGLYGATVGIISLGMIGRKVCELLKPFQVRVLAYDPYVSREQAESLGATLCGLEQLFAESDIVSLHAPLTEETAGMIRGHHLAAMKQHASFINTARGRIVNEAEMIDVLRQRPDLQAILDVTDPEPPVPGSPLYSLPNVFLTPHISGSIPKEHARMGELVLEELKRYMAGRPPLYRTTREMAKTMA